VDLASVYMLIRRETLGPGKVEWDEVYKIGGEHGDFYMDMTAAGWQTAFVLGADMPTFPFDPALCHPDYYQFRNRSGWREHFRDKHQLGVYDGMCGVDRF
jgi:hypothetical protein